MLLVDDGKLQLEIDPKVTKELGDEQMRLLMEYAESEGNLKSEYRHVI